MDISLTNVHLGGVALLLAVGIFIIKSLRSPLNKIPGPWHTQWTGLVSRYHSWKGHLPPYIHSLHEAYGPIIRTGPKAVYIADPAAYHQMTSVKNEFLKEPQFYWALHPGISNVFTTVRIDVHRHFRRLLAAGVSDSGLRAFHKQIEPKPRAAIAGMQAEMETRGAADVAKWWHLMTLDVISELAFGETAGLLQRGEKDEFARDLEALGRAASIRVVLPELTWYLMPRFPIPPKSAENARRLRQHASEALRRHQRLTENTPEGEVRPTLFSKLYKARDEDALSFENLRDNAQVYMTAGTGTTATSLTFLVWSVCRREDVQRRLVAEVQGRVAALAAAAGGGGGEDFGYEDIKDLPYLNCVINETLRLFSVVAAGMPRVVPSGGATLVGQFVPAGTTVLAQSYTLHRNGRVFPRPEEFLPERWENPSKEMKDSIIVFGGGSRVCIGQHLAMMQMRLATCRFFHAFPEAKVSQREGMSDADMDASFYVLLSPKGRRCLIEAC
ncbi:putative benzoate 4-monooxygenase cytochrome P450 [Cryphonectria parasitica EP155]|uniref:Benzoate 4-monooxygenase cytochrome P450 n=1 Tax=Cryphonectria parasitica (strain ATCC 38755 / EP155) TaxID=660469 RepID=A0A9P4YA21_CRYP1|nr:putative benzoate 4-monooxygenase cytochrome P450 [Cryphonectria parasitica EP155]KAF3769546.1 putative benzoate 4-monooxygenase cytochrome P450 [Cryphonectria parasitica EP155]